MTKNSFAAINDQPFPLPRYFGIGHLSSFASGAQTILWAAQKFSGKKGRNSAVQNMAARDGFVGSAEPVALDSSPAAQYGEVEVACCEWLMPEHDFCGTVLILVSRWNKYIIAFRAEFEK